MSLEMTLRDVRLALRRLLRSPVYAAVAALVVAVGVGANTAVFSLVDAVVLRELPFRDPERLVWVWSTRTDRDRAFFSIADFVDVRERSGTLADIAAYANWGASLTDQGETERLQGVRFTPNALEMLGVAAAAGRVLLPDDGLPQSARVAVLGHGLWTRRFGGEPGVVGRTLRLNDDAYTVVGVLPRSFVLPGAEVEVAVPLLLEADPRRGDRGSNFLRAFARLAPGETREQAQAELALINDELRRLFPDSNAKKTAPRVLALHDEVVGAHRGSLLLLLGAVAAVLLVACANLANLLLVRASSRRTELAVRSSLGASRGDLVRHVLAEAAAVSALGGTLGLGLAVWGVRGLLWLSPEALPRAAEAAIDGRVLGLTVALSAAVALAVGLAPAIAATRGDLLELRSGGRGSAGDARGDRIRSFLVSTEVALSVALLVAAALFVKSLVRLQGVSPGFEPSGVVAVRVSLPLARYGRAETIAAFHDAIAVRVAALPGVEAVAAASVLPLSGMNVRADFTIDGRPPRTAADIPAAQNRWVSPRYFALMRIPVLRGRGFDEGDTRRAPPVVVVSESTARRFWPEGDALGAQLRIDDAAAEPRAAQVVGVAADVKHAGLDEEPTPTVYAPIAQVPDGTVSFLANSLNVVVRAAPGAAGLADAVRRELRAVDPEVAASTVRTMDQLVATTVAPRRFGVQLLGAFAATALSLAACGLFAVVSYSVTRRTREIGVRLALGARPSDVVWQAVRRGLAPLVPGLVFGLAGALALGRAASSQLYSVSPSDPAALVFMPVVLAATAAVAAYSAARRAARVDPVVALRSE
jgi:putative ABC transport system permease protein